MCLVLGNQLTGGLVQSAGAAIVAEALPEAQHLLFSGQQPGDYCFERSDWWIRQITELGHFYRRAQFGTAKTPDFASYRTKLRLGGEKADSFVQETDTISRLVYGFATAR